MVGRDLMANERPGQLRVRLRCTRCRAHRRPIRRPGDPDNVVRCRECGKRHSTDSLEAI